MLPTVEHRAVRRFQRRTRTLRRGFLLGILTLSLAQASCYTIAPASQARAVPGTRLTFTLTDRGRVALAEQIGASVLEVEGTLVQDSGADYVLRVSAIRSIDGSKTRWDGERISINHDAVATTRQRIFSKGRTAVAVAATTVAVTAFIITRNLRVFGIGPAPPKEPPAPPNQ
jgi:hypothetical protein